MTKGGGTMNAVDRALRQRKQHKGTTQHTPPRQRIRLEKYGTLRGIKWRNAETIGRK